MAFPCPTPDGAEVGVLERGQGGISRARYRNVLIIVKVAVHDSLYCWVRRVDYDACGLHQEHSNMDAALASDHYYNPRTILIADDSVR